MSQPTYRARRTDPVTSHLAAVGTPGRVSQRNRILLGYALANRWSLTDEQAAEEAGVSPRSCWWRRCSELRELGHIAPLRNEDGLIHVMSSQGKQVMTSMITPAGKQYLRSEGLLDPTN